MSKQFDVTHWKHEEIMKNYKRKRTRYLVTAFLSTTIT